MKFTFKKVIHEGRWRSFQPESHKIKFNKEIVGDISQIRNIGICNQRSDDGKFKIRLMVNKKDIMEDGNPNCVWKNIFLHDRFDTAQEAKDFLNTHIKTITTQYRLHTRGEYEKKESLGNLSAITPCENINTQVDSDTNTVTSYIVETKYQESWVETEEYESFEDANKHFQQLTTGRIVKKETIYSLVIQK